MVRRARQRKPAADSNCALRAKTLELPQSTPLNGTDERLLMAISP
jgi:hypothetical protein